MYKSITRIFSFPPDATYVPIHITSYKRLLLERRAPWHREEKAK